MPESAASSLGFVQALRGLLGTFLALISSRAELAAVEWKEEQARGAEILILAALGIFSAAMATVTLTALVVILFWSHATWVLTAIALVYGSLAIFAWRAAKKELAKPFFPETISQLKKDTECLLPPT